MRPQNTHYYYITENSQEHFKQRRPHTTPQSNISSVQTQQAMNYKSEKSFNAGRKLSASVKHYPFVFSPSGSAGVGELKGKLRHSVTHRSQGKWKPIWWLESILLQCPTVTSWHKARSTIFCSLVHQLCLSKYSLKRYLPTGQSRELKVTQGRSNVAEILKHI